MKELSALNTVLKLRELFVQVKPKQGTTDKRFRFNGKEFKEFCFSSAGLIVIKKVL